MTVSTEPKRCNQSLRLDRHQRAHWCSAHRSESASRSRGSSTSDCSNDLTQRGAASRTWPLSCLNALRIRRNSCYVKSAAGAYGDRAGTIRSTADAGHQHWAPLALPPIAGRSRESNQSSPLPNAAVGLMSKLSLVSVPNHHRRHRAVLHRQAAGNPQQRRPLLGPAVHRLAPSPHHRRVWALAVVGA